MNKPLGSLMHIVLAFLVLGAAPAHGARGSIRLEGKSHEFIRVVMDANYPPYTYRSPDGTLQGILVDQWREWGKVTGITPVLHGMDWEKAQGMMLKGHFDVIDTMFRTKERERLYSFSKPYVRIGVPVFYSSMLSGISGPSTLAGFTVAVKRGDSAVSYLKGHGITDFKEYSSYEEIIRTIRKRNRKDIVFVMGKPPAMYYLYKYGLQDAFRYSEPLFEGEFHRAVRKGNEELLGLVDRGFDVIPEDRLKAIDKRWNGEGAIGSAFMRSVLYVLGALTLLVVTMLVWNNSLKSLVRRRTFELSDALVKLRIKENENGSIIQAVPGSIFILDMEGIFRYVRLDADMLETPMAKEGMVGKRYTDIFPPSHAAMLGGIMGEVRSMGIVRNMEFQAGRSPSSPWYEAHVGPCGDGNTLMVLRNITARKTADQRMYELSIRDSITGFFNRNYLEGLFEGYKEACPKGTGIMVCDIDGLKLVNDTFGHLKGDEYIRVVAGVLRDIIGDDAVIARFGGDEFTALFKDTDEARLEVIKDRIEEMVENSVAELGMPLSISVGYAVSADDGRTVYDLYKEADDYMYSDKAFHLRSMKSKYVDLMSKMLEVRDFLTEGHGERLKEIAVRMAVRAGFSSGELMDLKLLAQFHDIGKIGIADAILFKEAGLTPEEMEIMKRHTEIGYRIAQASPELSRISDYILKHHERFDGKGYPLGLSGSGIPVHCRILSIIDAFDAMTNDRPYRRAMPEATALKELEACSGSQFDPVYVELFKDILRRDETESA